MAFIFDEGRRAVTGAYCWFYFKEVLKSAGWSCVGSGDGTGGVGASNFSNTSDIITTPAAGTGGMGNTNAWVRMRMPAINGITREFIFQMANANGGFASTSKYSFSAGFSGGSPNSTTPPTAADEQTFGAGSFGTNDCYRIYAGADNAAPYGAWLFPIPNGISTPAFFNGGFLIDPIAPGTGPVADKDPYIFWVDTNASTGWSANNLSNSQTASRTYYGKGTSEEKWDYVSAIVEYEVGFSGQAGAPLGRGTNPYTLDEEIEPIWWGRSSGNLPTLPNQIKGRGTILRWNGVVAVVGKVLTDQSTRDRICVSDVNFPHGGGLPIY